MCEAFAVNGVEVELWHPMRRNDYHDNSCSGSAEHREDNIKRTFEHSGISSQFLLKRLFSIDSLFLQRRAEKLGFYLQSFSFLLSCVVALQKGNAQQIVFIRDTTALVVFSIAKKLRLIQQKIIFEAHKYSKFIDQHIDSTDALIVISHQLRQQLDADGTKNALVAHAGIRKEDLAPQEPISIRASTTEKIILYTGNLFRWKGVYTLADCASLLPSNYKLVFVGGSPDALPEFSSYTQNLPQVEVVGFRPRREIGSYLQAADILILPNSAKDDEQSYVTSPLKLFEYMAARKPIVASRLPSIEEVLQDHKNAILFSPDDTQDLARKIDWVLTNDCSSLVERAWEDVQTYTWSNRANKIMSHLSIGDRPYVTDHT